MDEKEKGKKFIIHSYKHDGSIHRAWDEAVLLDSYDNLMIFGNDHTTVTEFDGRRWHTKEPAIMFFFKDKWYNVIGQIKHDGIYYYCNMATPFIIEKDTIKYIDYDLDLRVFPDGAFKVLDRGEYKYHKTKMNYPEEIDKIIKHDLTELIEIVREKKFPFDKNKIEDYNNLYNNIKKEVTSK